MRGHSLLELTLGIAIIAILATVVLVSLKPNEELARTELAKARSEANALTQSIRLFANDRKALPVAPEYVFAPGGTAVPICTQEYGAQFPDDCVSLIPLLGAGYIGAIPVQPSHASDKYTGFYYRSCDGEKFLDVVATEDAGQAVECP